MADFNAPSGPPPPRVPEGWKAIWNQQYQEWFYVNLVTKESTWEKPTAPASHGGDDFGAGGAPPSYQAGPNAPVVSDHKKTDLNNTPHTGESDEEMARRLQREEDERRRGAGGVSPLPGAAGDRGHSDGYYNTGSGGQPPYAQQGGYQGGYQNTSSYPTQSPGVTSDQKRSGGGGLFGKLKDKLAAGSGSRPGGMGGYGQQQHGYGGYPQQGYGQPMMGGHGGMMGGHGGMMGPGMMGGGMMGHGMAGRKKPGMGAGGAAALGVGGGLLGGMMLANAMDDDHGDYGGGDYGGGDDFGGGDMGGGDF